MANFTVAARFTADSSQFVGATKRGEQALDQLQQKAKTVRGEIVGALSGFAAGAVAAISIKELAGAFISASDASANLRSQLVLATGTAAGAASAYEALYGIAQQTGQSFNALGGTYAQLARATADLGISQTDLLGVTKAVSQTVALSGASAQSAQAALVQLSQGLAAGALRGEEFNSVSEQTPALARAIAEGLGVTIGKLREMAKDGELTAEVIIGAMTKMREKIQSDYDKLTPTVERSWERMKNSVSEAFAQINEGAGLTRAIAEAMDSVSAAIDRNMPKLREYAAGVRAAFLFSVKGLPGVDDAGIDRELARGASNTDLQTELASRRAELQRRLQANNMLGRAQAAVSGGADLQRQIRELATLQNEADKRAYDASIPVADYDEAGRLARNHPKPKPPADKDGKKDSGADKAEKRYLDSLKQSARDSYAAWDAERQSFMRRNEAELEQAKRDDEVRVQYITAARESGSMKEVEAIERVRASRMQALDEEQAVLGVRLAQQREIADGFVAGSAEQRKALDAVGETERRVRDIDVERGIVGVRAAADITKSVLEEANARAKGLSSTLEALRAAQAEEDARVIHITEGMELEAAREEVAIRALRSYLERAEALGELTESEQQMLDIERIRLDMMERAQGLALYNREDERRRKAQEKAEADAERERIRAAEQLEKTISDSLMRGFEKGKSLWLSFRETLINSAKTMILTPIIKPIAETGSKLLTTGVEALINGFIGGATGGGWGGGASRVPEYSGSTANWLASGDAPTTRAGGGLVPMGKSAWVGEEGPELLRNTQHGPVVIPTDIANASNNNITRGGVVNIYQTFNLGNEVDGRTATNIFRNAKEAAKEEIADSIQRGSTSYR